MGAPAGRLADKVAPVIGAGRGFGRAIGEAGATLDHFGRIGSLTRAPASEGGQHGITVNAIAPGGIETDMSRDVMTDECRARRLSG